jgi:hypothetical protein
LLGALAEAVATRTAETRLVLDAMLTAVARGVAHTDDAREAATVGLKGSARQFGAIIAFAAVGDARFAIAGSVVPVVAVRRLEGIAIQLGNGASAAISGLRVARGAVGKVAAPMARGVLKLLLSARALPIHRGTLVRGIRAVAIDTRPVETATVTHLASLPLEAAAGTVAAVPLSHVLGKTGLRIAGLRFGAGVAIGVAHRFVDAAEMIAVGANRTRGRVDAADAIYSTGSGVRIAAATGRVINNLTGQLEGQDTLPVRQRPGVGRLDRPRVHPHHAGIVTADLGRP